MINWLASIPAPLKILVFIGLGLVLLLLLYPFYRLVNFWIGLSKLKLKDRFAIKNDFIKTAAQILGGAFFLFGLYFTWSNLVATQEKNITELYTKAIEQLGSDRLEVRLGGIYALERIARESEKDHWPIVEVLTAYVRENAPWPPETLTEARKKRPWARPKEPGPAPPKKGKTEKPEEITIKPDPDIQAVLTVIGRRTLTFKKGEHRGLDLRETDLRGADLREARLEGAMLDRAHMEEANLWFAKLGETSFVGAHLERAWFGGAHFEGAYFSQARLNEADFQNTDLRMVKNLKAEQLRPARNWVLAYIPVDILQKLALPLDHNQRLEHRDLSHYNLAGMDLRGANLSNIKGLTREQLAVANTDKETVPPHYLQEPQPGKPESK